MSHFLLVLHDSGMCVCCLFSLVCDYVFLEFRCFVLSLLLWIYFLLSNSLNVWNFLAAATISIVFLCSNGLWFELLVRGQEYLEGRHKGSKDVGWRNCNILKRENTHSPFLFGTQNNTTRISTYYIRKK